MYMTPPSIVSIDPVFGGDGTSRASPRHRFFFPDHTTISCSLNSGKFSNKKSRLS